MIITESICLLLNLPTIKELNCFFSFLKYKKHCSEFVILYNNIDHKIKFSDYKFYFSTKEKNREFNRLFRKGGKKKTQKFEICSDNYIHISNHSNLEFEKDIVDIINKITEESIFSKETKTFQQIKNNNDHKKQNIHNHETDFPLTNYNSVVEKNKMHENISTNYNKVKIEDKNKETNKIKNQKYIEKTKSIIKPIVSNKDLSMVEVGGGWQNFKKYESFVGEDKIEPTKILNNNSNTGKVGDGCKNFEECKYFVKEYIIRKKMEHISLFKDYLNKYKDIKFKKRKGKEIIKNYYLFKIIIQIIKYQNIQVTVSVNDHTTLKDCLKILENNFYS